MKSLRHQSGIAIAPILFIVALLAVLATAIAAGSGTFSSGSEQESARTLASTIITIGQQYQAAVQRLMAMGCGKDQISFDAPGLPSSIANPRAPADGHCSIYGPQGGGLVMNRLPDAAINDPTDDYSQGYLALVAAWKGYPYVIGVAKITGFGTAQSEIILLIHGLKSGVCSAINSVLKRNSTSARVYTPEKLGPYQMRDHNQVWCDTHNYGASFGCNEYPSGLGGNDEGHMYYFYAILLVQ